MNQIGAIALLKHRLRPRRSKYRNIRTRSHDGVEHASRKQSVRWVLLTQQQRLGEIRNLRREVPYRLEVNGQLICKYVADHVYEEPIDEIGWAEVVEDVKSDITRKNRAYRIKVKLLKALLGIEIREV